jgi:hypothetical protein
MDKAIWLVALGVGALVLYQRRADQKRADQIVADARAELERIKVPPPPSSAF